MASNGFPARVPPPRRQPSMVREKRPPPPARPYSMQVTSTDVTPEVPSRPGRTASDFRKPRPKSQEILEKAVPRVPTRRPSVVVSPRDDVLPPPVPERTDIIHAAPPHHPVHHQPPGPKSPTLPPTPPVRHAPTLSRGASNVHAARDAPPAPPVRSSLSRQPSNGSMRKARPAPPVPIAPQTSSDFGSEDFAALGKQIFNDSVGVVPKRRVPPKYVRVDVVSDVPDGFLFVEEDDVIEVDRMHVDGEVWQGRVWDPMRGKSTGCLGKFYRNHVSPIMDPNDPWDATPIAEEWEDDPVALMQENMRQAKIQEAKDHRHKIWRDANRLFLSLLELLTNEYKYVTSLKICNELFVEPLQVEFGASITGSLFPNWDTMAKTHLNILSNLVEVSRPNMRDIRGLQAAGHTHRPKSVSHRKSISANLVHLNTRAIGQREMKAMGDELDDLQLWHDTYVIDRDEELPDTFLENFKRQLYRWAIDLCTKLAQVSENFKVSSLYIRNYNEALRNFTNWNSTIPKFEARIKEIEQNPLAGGLSISAFLIKPVQHICRYPLLIREIHKNVPPEIEPVIGDAQLQLVQVTTEVNSMQSNPSKDDGRVTINVLIDSIRYSSATSGPAYETAQKCKVLLAEPAAHIISEFLVQVGPSTSTRLIESSKSLNVTSVYQCFVLNSCILITEMYENVFAQGVRYKLRALTLLSETDEPKCVDAKTFTLPLKSGERWVLNVNDPHSTAESCVRDILQAIAVMGNTPKDLQNARRLHGSFADYGQMRQTQQQIQSSNPSQLLQMQANDPLLSELTSKLKQRPPPPR